MTYRGYKITRTTSGDYYVNALGTNSLATNQATARRWIDQAIASGELKRID